MVGDKCVDCLVLGSQNMSLQKPMQDAGGASAVSDIDNNEERGSNSYVELKEREQRAKEMNIERIQNYNKRTKVPLVGYTTAQSRTGKKEEGLPKTVQIVVRRVGLEKERFGSVSFSLKRFLKSSGKNYFHWVTLYDSLDDDLFEGELGVDDDMDFPRVLLEYQVVSSQFTSMINKMDKFKGQAQQFRND